MQYEDMMGLMHTMGQSECIAVCVVARQAQAGRQFM